MADKVNYIVKVNVLEARELKGSDISGVSPFIKIKCGNIEEQKTFKNENENSTVWNQSFTFPNLQMNKYELEQFELIFECYDHNRFYGNEYIGGTSIGLSTMYRHSQEFYKVWLRLMADDNPSKVQGYLKVSAFIVGPDDEQPVHAENEFEASDCDDQDEEMEAAGMDQMAILDAQRARNGLATILAPQIQLKPYQLIINIYKGEGIPFLSEDTACKTFISVRTQMANLTTGTISGSSPGWRAKLYFPIYLPTCNDKITMRLWHSPEYGLLQKNMFLANIPECPGPGDTMNISQLISLDGTMDPYWINLYGIAPEDRGKGINVQHVSNFMGRILVSLHLQQNDRPQFQAGIGQHLNEPAYRQYHLWIDIHDLVNCEELLTYKTVWIEVSMGPHKLESPPEKRFKGKQLKGKWTWKEPQLPFPDIEVPVDKNQDIDLPVDQNQIPDCFIHLYTKTNFKDKERIGFMRIKADELLEKNVKPKWKQMYSLKSAKKTVGLLLMSGQLVAKDNKKAKARRTLIQRGAEVQYHFFPQIISGFELAPEIPEGQLETQVKYEIGSQIKQTKGKKKSYNLTKKVAGRFPFWGHFKKSQSIMLNQNTAFASDMRVSLMITNKQYYGADLAPAIGSFLVPIESLMKLYLLPQFYNVIDSEGNIQGRILARFFLLQKTERTNEQQINNIQQHFIDQLTAKHKVDIKISMIGIRSLSTASDQAEIKVSLTHHAGKKSNLEFNVKEVHSKKDKHKTANEDDDEEAKGNTRKMMKWNTGEFTKNPNIGAVITIPDVELTDDAILWPYIKIKVYEQGIKSGQMTSQVIVPLFLYAGKSNRDDKMHNDEMHGILELSELKLTLALSTVTQINSQVNIEQQEQIHPIKAYFTLLEKQYEKHVKVQEEFDLTIDANKQNQLENILKTFDEVQNKLIEEELKEKATLTKKNEQKTKWEDILRDFKFKKEYRINHKEFYSENQETCEFEANRKKKKGKDEGPQTELMSGDDSRDDMSDEDDENSDKTELSLDEIFVNIMKKANGESDGDEDYEKQGDKKKGKNQREQKGDYDQLEGFDPYEVDPVPSQFKLHLKCTKEHKRAEKVKKKEETKRYTALEYKLKKLFESAKAVPEFKEMIGVQMMLLRRKLEDLEQGVMTSERFIGFQDDAIEEGFDYQNREKLERGNIEEHASMLLPFKKVPLYVQHHNRLNLLWGAADNITIDNGFLHSGKPDGSFIRCAIRVIKDETATFDNETNEQSDSAYGDEDEEDSELERLYDQSQDSNNGSLTAKMQALMQKKFQMKQQQEYEYEMKVDRQKAREQFRNSDPNIDRILQYYKFDPFQKGVLNHLTETQEFKVRVYILNCQQLSAVDNYVDATDMLAGARALSSADPYPYITIGDGENDSKTKKIKRINDILNVKLATLNPKFYTTYELDAVFPDDNKLTIEIYDKSSVLYRDKIIGRTIIDLEERRFGLKYNQSKEIISIKKNKEDIEEIGVNANYNAELEELKADLLQLNKWNNQINEKEKSDYPKVPVEYRSLTLEGQEQSQGIIEMWVEVLTQSEARIVPSQALSQSKQQEDFEIRLIVWETRDIPLVQSNGTSDVYIKAIFHPDGLQSIPVECKTDVHNGCNDGRAVFNYRMKFTLTMPSEFPRIKLQAYDSNAFSGDESIGETTLSIKNTVNILRKHGQLEDKKVWLGFNNPNSANDSAGYVVVSLQILPLIEADQNKVGEGQSEPNINPKLIKPTEGRGIGAYAASFNLPSMPELPQMAMLRNITYLVIAVLIIGSIFYLMSYFK